MERPRVAHAVGAVDEYLELAEILLGPVHAQAQCVALVVDESQPLTAQYWPG
jgi:hypothetical protein